MKLLSASSRCLLSIILLFCWSVPASSQQLAVPGLNAVAVDSLNGFDEAAVWQQLTGRSLDPKEMSLYVEHQKRRFISAKYFPAQLSAPALSSKFTNTAAVLNGSPCVNEGFESTSAGAYSAANSVNGWTLTSALRNLSCVAQTSSWTAGSPDFSIHTTPIVNVPGIGTLTHSPLGGTKVAQLNDFVSADYSVTRLSQTFPVTTSNNLLRFAFASVLQESTGHTCCEQPGFEVVIKNCSGQPAACLTQSIIPSTTCSAFPSTFTNSSGTYWNSWQIRQVDLTPFIGSCVTIEFIAFDCSLGAHYGSVFLDTECTTPNTLPCVCPILNQPNPVSYCPGGPALIQAPAGFATYQWISPVSGTLNAPSSTMTAITVTNPVAASVYSVLMTAYSNCQYIATFTLATTQVSISAISTVGTCSAGASGAATVFATGSGGGYSYVWANASSSVVSTSSVANNLPTGIYTVMISAQNNSSCGTSAATVNIGVQQPATQFYSKPFCGGVAILNTPPGSNHKWYSGTSLVSSNPVYNPSSPATGQIYRVGYQNSQGCRDSIVYTLLNSSAGNVQVTQNPAMCPGASNGMAVLSLTPAGTQVPGISVTFSVVATGTTPSFNFTTSLTGLNTVTLTGLYGWGTYSIVAFDGSCYTSNLLQKNTYFEPVSFSVAAVFSPTICQGSSVPLKIVSSPSTSTGQYSYSWSPSQGLTPSAGLNVLATPTVAPGTASAVIYTVAITPTTINCPTTKTVAVFVSHPATGTITSPGIVCTNYAPFFVTAIPPGGNFIYGTGTGLSLSGQLTPASANLGPHTFTYQTSINNCLASSASSYTVVTGPSLAVSGNTSICAGETTTLNATGAQIYFWPGFGNSDQIIVAPAATTSYVVTGSSANGCNASHMAIVFVTPQPSVTILGNTQICAGESAVLTASGADNFAWSNNVLSAQNTVSPLSTTAYSVLGLNLPGNCTHTQVVTITVHPSPTVTISGKNTVCAGDLLQLTASGAQGYEWDGIPGAAVYTAIVQANTSIVVKGIDQNGCTHSNVVSVVVEDCTGIVEGGTEQVVTIFPNPFLTHLNLAVNVASEIKVYDALGKLIHKRQLSRGSHQIDMRNFSSGVYYLQVENPSGKQIRKVMKTEKHD